MKQEDAIALIQTAITGERPQRWADLGSGKGTFTHVLQNLLPDGSQIRPIDTLPQNLPNFIRADFKHDDLPLANLDGILLANSLHYLQDKIKLIHKLETYFAAEPTFLIIEYDTNQANTWVPYPIAYNELQKFFNGLGYQNIHKLAQRRSIYNRANLYSAFVKK